MKSNSGIYISFIIAFGFFAYGCNDDDTNSGSPAQPQYPATLTFDEIIDRDFRMWTAGAEISTTGLNPSDFINPEDYASMSEEYFMSGGDLTFTEDSVMSSDQGQEQTLAYYFSNDSLFIVTNSFFGDMFFGTGDLNELTHTQGYLSLCQQSSGFLSCSTESGTYSHDLESALDEFDELNSVADISAGDTLIIFNQKIILSR